MNRARRGLALAALLAAAACSDPILDPLLAVDASVNAADDLARGPGDLGPDGADGGPMLTANTLVAGTYFLAHHDLADTLFAYGLGPGVHLVSIGKSDGAVSPLLDDASAAINDLQADDAHLYWSSFNPATVPTTIKRATVAGAGATTLFDPSALSTGGLDTLGFYVSTSDQRLYLLLSGTTPEVGWIPLGGGTYTKLMSVSYAGASAYAFSARDALTALGGKVYVGGRATVNGAHVAFMAVVGAGTLSVSWSLANGDVTAIATDGARVFWTVTDGQIYGHDPTSSKNGAIAQAPAVPWSLVAATDGALYTASLAGDTTTLSRTVPAMAIDMAGVVTPLDAQAACTISPGCLAHLPTVAVDATTAYYSTDGALLRVPR